MAYKTLFIFLIGLSIHCKVDSQKWGAIKGEGDVVRQEIKLDAFHGINLSIAGELVLTQGPTQQVVIEAQQNIIDNIRKEVKGGSWNIEYIKYVTDEKQVKITVTVPNLDDLGLCGSGTITSTNTFQGISNLEINVSGSGHLQFNFEAQNTEVSLSGSGKLNLEGKSSELDIAISGSGVIDAEDLKTKGCEVSISGSGDAALYVDGDLETEISGSGDVTYAGNTSVHASISGSGSVTKR